jgi:hypothetical protein
MMESHGRHADFRKPRWGTTPLLSQTATGRWREANPGRANPKAAGDSRANPTSDLPDSTSLNPQRPTAHIQVGGSLSRGVASSATPSDLGEFEHYRDDEPKAAEEGLRRAWLHL